MQKHPEGHQTDHANVSRKYADKNIHNMILSGIYCFNNNHREVHLSITDLLDLSKSGRLPKIDQNRLSKLNQLQKSNSISTVKESMATAFINALFESGFYIQYTGITGNTPTLIDIKIEDNDEKSLYSLMESFYKTLKDKYRVMRELSLGDFYFQNHLVLDASSRVLSPEDESICYYEQYENKIIPIEKEYIEKIQDSLSEILDHGYEDTVSCIEDLTATISQAKLDDYHGTMHEYRVTMSRQLADLKMMLHEDSCKAINIKAYMEKHFDAFISFTGSHEGK